MTTDNPQFLALVARIDNCLDTLSYLQHPLELSTMEYDLDWSLRALKGEIMRHAPAEDGYCKSCSWGMNDPTDQSYFASFPCKPFSDIESEVGRQ